MTTEWTLIDLFAGLGGFSAAFTDSPQWSVTTVDIDESFDPDITADVCDLGCGDLPDPDVVLASPPCKCFSVAAAWQEHFDSDGNPQTAAARVRAVQGITFDSDDPVALVYENDSGQPQSGSRDIAVRVVETVVE